MTDKYSEKSRSEISDPGTSENLGRRREPAFNLPTTVLALIGLCVSIHIVREFLLSPQNDLGLIFRLAFLPPRWGGEEPFEIYAVTSTVTYSVLHGSWLHLGINMIWLAAFGAPLANRLGAWRFLLFWINTAIASAVFFFVLHSGDYVVLVGASGAISAMMAAAARFSFATSGHGRFRSFAGPPMSIGAMLAERKVVAFVLVWFFANFMAGAGIMVPGGEDQIAWEAHIAGFVAGFLLIPFLRERR